MPDRYEAVLFDYGRTLVTFDYPTDALLDVMRRFGPRLSAALGEPAPDPHAILRTVLMPLEKVIASVSEDEVDYMNVYRAAWSGAAWPLPDTLLHDILDAEQLCWDAAVRVAPGALDLLAWLAKQGIKRGICSNAPFPSEMMRRQLRSNGIAELVDGAVFSSEVGRRKPALEVYEAALRSIGAQPHSTLFVGDRLLEDYIGPTAAGMRAVLVAPARDPSVPPRVPTVSSLREVRRLV